MENEKETAIIQRRSIRAKHNLESGNFINRDDLVFLRPCPPEGIEPYKINNVIGRKLRKTIVQGNLITEEDFE